MANLRLSRVVVQVASVVAYLLPGSSHAAAAECCHGFPLTVLQHHGHGIAPETALTLSELFSVELSRVPGLRINSDADIRRMLDVEAEKQAFGCDESSCPLEIASALGTRYVVSGTVGTHGNLVLITVNLFDSDFQRSVW